MTISLGTYVPGKGVCWAKQPPGAAASAGEVSTPPGSEMEALNGDFADLPWGDYYPMTPAVEVRAKDTQGRPLAVPAAILFHMDDMEILWVKLRERKRLLLEARKREDAAVEGAGLELFGSWRDAALVALGFLAGAGLAFGAVKVVR